MNVRILSHRITAPGMAPPAAGRAAAAAVAAASALLLAACSSAASSPTATGGTSSPGSSSPSAGASYDAAIANLVPASIRTSGTIPVASNATYPPDEYYAADNTTIIGFDPDLATAVGQILGVKLTFVNTAFDDIIPALQAGRFAMAWSSATATAARQQQVNFVTYFSAGVGFLVPAGSTLHIHGLADLCGLKVAVEAGSLEDTTAAAQSARCTAAGKQPISLQRYQDENENLLALTSGRAQVSTAGSQIIPYLVRQSGGKLKTVGGIYDRMPLGIEFSKTAPISLAKAFQAALNKMIVSGSYGRILAKWGEQEGAVTEAEILPASAAGTAG
ncbi:MAG TPA: ABC transporter substrate-binding protein [Streptosporangiaceae bacterium]|jgi:polar amino acid transport system substrate-binding protein|nr:ABC transporter substrate-binding protein [Streptosporangiaceae bacterium]